MTQKQNLELYYLVEDINNKFKIDWWITWEWVLIAIDKRLTTEMDEDDYKKAKKMLNRFLEIEK